MGAGNKAIALIVIVLLPWLPCRSVPCDTVREASPTRLKVGKQAYMAHSQAWECGTRMRAWE